MNKTDNQISIFPTLLFAGLCLSLSMAFGFAAESKVSLATDSSGNHTLLRNGEPYRILGVGGTSHLKDLAEAGGNSIRTWGIESLEEKIEGMSLLDYCQKLGITVTAGIWIGHKRHGFRLLGRIEAGSSAQGCPGSREEIPRPPGPADVGARQ